MGIVATVRDAVSRDVQSAPTRLLAAMTAGKTVTNSTESVRQVVSRIHRRSCGGFIAGSFEWPLGRPRQATSTGWRSDGLPPWLLRSVQGTLACNCFRNLPPEPMRELVAAEARVRHFRNARR